MSVELDQLAEELTLDREVDEGDIVSYYNEKNELHRVNGPAVIFPNGTNFWYQNDKKHRLDGPAMVYSDGDEYWYQNDKKHRLDGPAVIYTDGSKYWFIDGVLYTEQEFNAHPLVVAHKAKSAL